jgi:phosphoglycolate phosphatase
MQSIISNMIKLVVFDWNGVLIDDAQANADTVSHILKSYGRSPITLERYRDIFEIPARKIYLQEGFSEEEIEREGMWIQEMFHQDYEPRIAGVEMREGARVLLEWLAEKEVECIILSNHVTEAIEFQLKRLEIKNFFSVVLANNPHDAMHAQNKYEKLIAFLKDRPYRTEEVLIIGDSVEETQAGKKAGIHTVAITGGYVSEARLRQAKPDHLIHNLTSMIDIIKKV